ncbi:hypothetical protein MBLNU230_g0109t1 [Neophaeotheca triangularis]
MKSFTTFVAASAAFNVASALPGPMGKWGPWGSKSEHHQKNAKKDYKISLGPRPYYLVDDMDDGPLKEKLESCSEGENERSNFVISHRGAPLMFPEHSRQGYEAAARMGAGIMECDVSFTSDRQLVCRHSNCDLHYTTNILAHPDLAAKCSEPFVPYDPETGTEATAKCCTSDITLDEYYTLCPEMEATTFNARNASEFSGRTGSTPDWRTNLYAYSCTDIMSMKDMIEISDELGMDFTAEAKEPEIPMPFDGDYTQEDFISQIADEFLELGIDPSRVWLQSFVPDDIYFWLENYPDFGKQAVFLDERADQGLEAYEEAVASLQGIADRGVKIIAPSTWQLVTVDNATQQMAPSSYAVAAKEAGLEIITWTVERSPPLSIDGGGYYYTGLSEVINNDGDQYTLIDVLTQQVGVTHIFVDWPGTLTYYANCFGIK